MGVAVTCAHCGEPHDLSEIEPSLQRPDALLVVPEQDRGKLTYESRSVAVLYGHRNRTLLGRLFRRRAGNRYFLRCVLPVPVHGRERALNWGIWVEVSSRQYERFRQLWDDPEQHKEPPFDVVLANNIWCYQPTLGLPAKMFLQNPHDVPWLQLEEGTHQLIREQAEGVAEARVMEWVEPLLHRQMA